MKRQFRTLPVTEPVAGVDRDARVLFGVSVAQAVEAIGHNMVLDERTLEQIVELGNDTRSGVKSRFTHPGLSSDGLGKFLGRVRDLRVENDKAVGDLHLSDLAFKSRVEGGDTLGDYVMTAAEQEGDAFGFSIVFDGNRVWTLADGNEVPVGDSDERPGNALTDIPVARIEELAATDLVDEPAANRDGMFSQFLWGTNQLSEEVFTEIDRYVEQTGLGPAKVFELALKYADSRDVEMGSFKDRSNHEMGNEKEQETQAVSQKDLAQLKEETEALREQLAAKEEAEQEAQVRAQRLEEALDNSNERIADLEAEKQRDRFRGMAKEWFGDTGKHVAVLERLAAESGEDGDEFQFYVQTQDAQAEQLAQSDLLKEIGRDSEPAGGSALGKIEAEAKRIRAENPSLTKAQAFTQAAKDNPELYSEYNAENERGR